MQWPNDALPMAQAILQGDANDWGAKSIQSNGIDGRLQVHSRHMWHTLTSALKTDFPNFGHCPSAIDWWQNFIAATAVGQISDLPNAFVRWLNEQDISNAWLARAQFDAAMQEAIHQPDFHTALGNTGPIPSNIAEVSVVRRATLVALLHSPKSDWQAERCNLALLREGDKVAQYYLSSPDYLLLKQLQPSRQSERDGLPSSLLDALSKVMVEYPDYPVAEKIPVFWQTNLIGVQS